jgi:hypothetical protein
LSCGNIAAALYYLDGSASFPGSGELLGISRKPPYSFTWNPYYASNGGHTIYVDYLGQTDNVVATSPTVSFYVENNLPQNTCPPNGTQCSDISVTPQLLAEMNVGGFNNVTNAISFYASSGTPAVVGGAPCGSAGSATGTVSCGTTTAGHTLAIYTRWQSGSSTLTCSGSGGAAGTVAYGTVAQFSGYSGQWCYIYNIAGGGSSVVTVSNSTSAEFLGTIAFEISGVPATNPIDINVASDVAATPAVSGPLNMSYAPAQELILMGSTWTGHTTATAGPGYPNIFTEPTNTSIAVEWINPAGTTFGTEQLAITQNGGAAAVSDTFAAFVDGTQVGTVTIAASATGGDIVFNTNAYLNTTTSPVANWHQVVVRADANNCPGCTGSTWTDSGGWEQAQAFTNAIIASQPMRLLVSCRECLMSVSGSPITVTGTELYQDGSTGSAAITCVIDPSPPVTGGSTSYFTNVGSGCVLTPTSTAGIDYLTATDAYGLSREFWGFNLGSGENIIGNFGTDGQMHAGYQANSVWFAAQFYSGAPIGPMSTDGSVTSSINWPRIFASAFAANGFTAVEASLAPTLPNAGNQSTFQSNLATSISTFKTNLSAYGAGRLNYVHLIGTAWFEGTPQMGGTLFAGGQSFSPPALTYAVQQWVNSAIAVGFVACDECTWGGQPLEGTNTGGILLGTNGFTALTGNGTTCTLTWTYPLNEANNSGNRFIFDPGSTGQATLDWDSTTNSPIFLRTGSETGGTVTFACRFNGTASTAQIEPYAYSAFTSTGTPCSTTSGTTPPSPCPNYTPYNVFATIRTLITNVTNYTPTSWTLANNGSAVARSNWSGYNAVAGVRAGDFWEAYWTPGGTYLPSHHSLSTMISALGDALRTSLATMQRTHPLISETSGTMIDYLYQGYQIPIASCSGNTVTTSTPHLISNVLPSVTKMWVTGSSGGGCDTASGQGYYIVAAPTAYTLRVVQSEPSFTIPSGSTNIGGTINFSNTIGGATVNSYTLTTMTSPTTTNEPGEFQDTLFGSCPNNVKNNRGLYFTVSGSSNSNVNAMTGWFDSGWTTNVCEANVVGGYQWWRQVPNLSSTGGTATISPDTWYRRGISWPTNSDSGPAQMFSSVNECAIEGCAGHRAYSFQSDPQWQDLTVVGPGSSWLGSDVLGNIIAFNPLNFTATIQAGLNPHADFARSAQGAQGHTNPNLLHARNLKYLYQTRLNSPDYGSNFEAAARTGLYGNILMIQSFVDNSITCTANLAPYLIAGQPVIRFSMTWDSIQAVDVIAAGTTTDSKTCAPGEFRAYLFPNNEAAELEQPLISAKLSDVTNAASIVVRYSYSPLSFRTPSVAAQTLYQVYNCGTGSCQLPVDKNIATLYYVLVYLNSSGAVLATSDVQTL